MPVTVTLPYDTIVRAVELADGWSVIHIYDGEDYAECWEDDKRTCDFHLLDPTRAGLNALAMQLLNQVYAAGKSVHFKQITDLTASAIDICISILDGNESAPKGSPDAWTPR